MNTHALAHTYADLCACTRIHSCTHKRTNTRRYTHRALRAHAHARTHKQARTCRRSCQSVGAHGSTRNYAHARSRTSFGISSSSSAKWSGEAKRFLNEQLQWRSGTQMSSTGLFKLAATDMADASARRRLPSPFFASTITYFWRLPRSSCSAACHPGPSEGAASESAWACSRSPAARNTSSPLCG
eukprot:6196019-Pleurochrysis_carterae.AAC.2